MRKVSASIILAALLFGGTALADIPDIAQFEAVQTSPFSWYDSIDDTGSDPWQVTKDAGFGGPEYYVNYLDDSWLAVPNREQSDMLKYFWLEIGFDPEYFTVTQDHKPFVADLITYGGESIDGPSISWNTNTNSIMWEWKINPQPGYEDIGFYNEAMTEVIDVSTFNIDGDAELEITQIAVGSACVPTPGALLLSGIGLVCIIVARRFRRS